MDYRYPPETEAFRQTLRQWLQENLSDDLRGLSNRGALSGKQLDTLRQWNHTMAAAGYAAISWPEENDCCHWRVPGATVKSGWKNWQAW